MNANMIATLNKKIRNNRGSGLGVILYGVTLLIVLLFVAINIVNAKVIENGYNSLRDAVQTAASGSVIHLLATNRETTTAQQNVISGNNGGQPIYDIYLQLALGYLINRTEVQDDDDDTVIQTGEINNFIKLDHQKVVNTTIAVLEDAVVRKKYIGKDNPNPITNTEDYKIMMFFIEPYRNSDGRKFFNIIAYGNGNIGYRTEADGTRVEVPEAIATSFVDAEKCNGKSMKDIYGAVEGEISRIVNCEIGNLEDYVTKNGTSFKISLNARGTSNYEELVREMETYPHYVIVVKDFALPTIFDGKYTNNSGSGIKSLFSSLSGDGSLSVPMCALNTGKIQRQVEEAGWSQKR